MLGGTEVGPPPLPRSLSRLTGVKPFIFEDKSLALASGSLFSVCLSVALAAAPLLLDYGCLVVYQEPEDKAKDLSPKINGFTLVRRDTERGRGGGPTSVPPNIN
jgi:hypothetical protein